MEALHAAMYFWACLWCWTLSTVQFRSTFYLFMLNLSQTLKMSSMRSCHHIWATIVLSNEGSAKSPPACSKFSCQTWQIQSDKTMWMASLLHYSSYLFSIELTLNLDYFWSWPHSYLARVENNWKMAKKMLANLKEKHFWCRCVKFNLQYFSKVVFFFF